jgi:hypothetical protein
MASITTDVDQYIGRVLDAELAGDIELEVEESQACGPVDSLPQDLLADAHDGARSGLVTIGDIDGVPLFYARGVAPRPQKFQVEAAFHAVCLATVKSVKFRVPDSYGRLKRITSAGTLVQKPGMHGQGRAFDHDAWDFERVRIRPIAQDHGSTQLATRRRYWALAAIMRSHSAHVLHGLYDTAHFDHLHHDNGGPIGFSTSSKATVKLVQAICRDIFGHRTLGVDGVYGAKSQAAVAAAMAKLQLSGSISDPSEFKRFLLRAGRLGFELGAPR